MTNQKESGFNTQYPQERYEIGKVKREQVPLSSHGQWAPAADRPDPVSLLQAQDEGRVQQLLPIKYGRMLESAFTFYRGSAVLMAADLATTPNSGIDVVLCGDAHLSNFGVFATPERKLVFDLNDFDEVYPGPWEWDLKRLAASAVIAGRDNGFKDKVNRKLARLVAQVYREAMNRFAKKSVLDVWYYHVEAEQVLALFDKYSKKGAKSTKKMLKKARTKTREATLAKLTEVVDGHRQIINDPPLLVRLSELLSEEQKAQIPTQHIKDSWLDYIDSLPRERHVLLSRFRIADGALRVGGVGSVGTRCTILLLEGSAQKDAIILQQKEAGPSVLEAYLPKRGYTNHAERVVIGQRLMQASSDIFLGWHQSTLSDRQYYWRQLKDMKGSVDVAMLEETGLGTYLGVCSLCLARAHARTGDSVTIAGYLGKSDSFDKAIGKFAVAYANQAERDYQALVEAVDSGRIIAQTGV
ncbi:MAG: DUF2252 domain-containing protein [Chloroflexota bacterium]|nr:MAG: DUF2252 domain-containing protein [Chloroflexota bacterium]